MTTFTETEETLFMKNINKTGITLLLLGTIGITGFAQTNYNFRKLQREKLNRGVVAVRGNAEKVAISWRYLSSDPVETAFNLYRNGEKIAHIPANTGTCFSDKYPRSEKAVYTVKTVIKGKESQKGESFTLPEKAPCGYINIPLEKPKDGITPAGEKYSYAPNDASIGDVDGDGAFEIILKWDPSNSHDNSHDGYTGNVFFDCYRLSGEKLWRIDLGKNIRAGAHYSPFMVYDFDGDGKAEIIMKTADGTIDGKGKVIGDPRADYREKGVNNQPPRNNIPQKDNDTTPRNQGRIISGNEYLTVFKGETGEALCSIDYIPPRGALKEWGDEYGNRCDRFLAAVAYLDGKKPSVVMCRGYYTRTVLAAFDWDGKELRKRWVFDSDNPGKEEYAGQGNHNLRVADIDKDGCDEIIYGSCTIDHTGEGAYSTGLGHGDAIHLTQFNPDIPKLQVWACHENKKDGATFRDAETGKILFQYPFNNDVGRCMAADIDPLSPGVEMWAPSSGGIRNCKGKVVAENVPGLSLNMGVWWDGDLLRELLDKNRIDKYDWENKVCRTVYSFHGCTANNGTKANPSLQGDIIGDWREEVLMRTEDNETLRLYVTTIPSQYRFHSFIEDPVYRISVATQNVAYNQPTQPGFYFGPDLKGIFRGYVFK